MGKAGRSERLRERARQWDLAKAIYGDAKAKKGTNTPSKKAPIAQKRVATTSKKATKTPSKVANPEPLKERRSCRVERIDYAEMLSKPDGLESSSAGESQEEENSQNCRWV